MGEQGKVTIKLQSSDGAEYELEEQTAAKFLFGDGVAWIHEVRGGAMMIPRVESNILSKVVAYCNKHAEDVGPVVLRTWDDEFINVDDVDILYDLIMRLINGFACLVVILVMNLERSWLNLMLYFGSDDEVDVKC
ncbi:putative S-phase kinase-associated protein [Dioscorea sansibarensis]